MIFTKHKIATLLFACTLQLTFCLFSQAQVPNKMSYQAIIRDGANGLVVNQQVGMQISILQGSANGAAVYVEAHLAPTNANGLVSIEVGGGTAVSGSMNSINWANGPYFIKTETDPTGGANYTISGTTQLLSVPYAMYAQKTANRNIFVYNTVNNTVLPQGTTNKLFCSLVYICGDHDNITFSNSPLPAGITVAHSNTGNILPFTDTLIITSSSSTIPGNYPITFTATASDGTFSSQTININIVTTSLNFQGSYIHHDSLYLLPNYTPFAYNGPFNSNVSAVVSNQFSISNFGQNGVTVNATVNTSSFNYVTFTIPSQVVAGCSYSGGGQFSLIGNVVMPYIYYTKTCAGTQYSGVWKP
ncbi:MAG: hypothetical protein ACK5P4_06990 [Bacteroidota bacterium]